MLLKTDYQDDILDLTQNANRKFNEVVNQDGSKSFEDVTEYKQEGTPFGAQDVNAITKALTDETHGISFQFGIDGNGDYGYIKDGETEVTPFRNRHTETYKPTVRANNNDMGLYHKKRYVDTTAVPNVNSDTQTINAVYTSGNGLDLGASNSVRYIKTNNLMVIPTATKSITANGNNQDVRDYAKVNVNVPNTLQNQQIVREYGDEPKTFSCNIGDYIVEMDHNHEPNVSGATQLWTMADYTNTMRLRLYQATSKSVTFSPTGLMTIARIYVG